MIQPDMKTGASQPLDGPNESAIPGSAWSWNPLAGDGTVSGELSPLLVLWRSKHSGRVLPRRVDFTDTELTPWLGQLCFAYPIEPDDYVVEIAGCELEAESGVSATARRLSDVARGPLGLEARAMYDLVLRRGLIAVVTGTDVWRQRRRIPWHGLVLPLAEDAVMVCLVANGGAGTAT